MDMDVSSFARMVDNRIQYAPDPEVFQERFIRPLRSPG